MGKLNSIILAMGLLLVACGKWPPIAHSAEDILKISENEPAVRVRGLVDNDIPALKHFKHLKILDFEGGWAVKNAKVTDKGLKLLSELELNELENLTLGFNDDITDDGLEYLVKLKTIKWLGLGHIPHISDVGLLSISSMTGLEGLDLRDCTQITDAGLMELAKLRNIKFLILEGCSKITTTGINALAAKLPEAKIKL